MSRRPHIFRRRHFSCRYVASALAFILALKPRPPSRLCSPRPLAAVGEASVPTSPPTEDIRSLLSSKKASLCDGLGTNHATFPLGSCTAPSRPLPSTGWRSPRPFLPSSATSPPHWCLRPIDCDRWPPRRRRRRCCRRRRHRSQIFRVKTPLLGDLVSAAAAMTSVSAAATGLETFCCPTGPSWPLRSL